MVLLYVRVVFCSFPLPLWRRGSELPARAWGSGQPCCQRCPRGSECHTAGGEDPEARPGFCDSPTSTPPCPSVSLSVPEPNSASLPTYPVGRKISPSAVYAPGLLTIIIGLRIKSDSLMKRQGEGEGRELRAFLVDN